MPDGGRHRRHLLPVRLCELAKPPDRFGKLLAPSGDLGRVFLFGFQKRCKRRDRRARLWPFASVAATKGRDVAAARHFDDEWIVTSDSRIISRQRLAHAHSLNSYDRVGLRVKIGAATERFDRDGVGFELVAVAGKGHLDNERKKACEAVRIAEGTAVNDPMKFLPDIVGMRSLRVCMSDVTVSPGKSILHRPSRWLNRPEGSSSRIHAMMPASVVCSNLYSLDTSTKKRPLWANGNSPAQSVRHAIVDRARAVLRALRTNPPLPRCASCDEL